MANEIRVQLKLLYNPANGDDISFPLIDNFINQTGVDFTQGTQEIGISAEEAIAVSSDIGTQGLWLIQNLDPTNFVSIGKVKVSVDADALGMKLLAGEFMFVRAASALYAKADTSAVSIRYICFEL